MEDFEKLHIDIGPILCKFEEKFPPAFFVMMIHLIVHFAQEARVGGCIHINICILLKGMCIYDIFVCID